MSGAYLKATLRCIYAYFSGQINDTNLDQSNSENEDSQTTNCSYNDDNDDEEQRLMVMIEIRKKYNAIKVLTKVVDRAKS